MGREESIIAKKNNPKQVINLPNLVKDEGSKNQSYKNSYPIPVHRSWLEPENSYILLLLPMISLKMNKARCLHALGSRVLSRWGGGHHCCTASPGLSQSPSETCRCLQCSQRWPSVAHHWTCPFSSGTASGSPADKGKAQGEGLPSTAS